MKSAYRVAEFIQSAFSFDDNDNVIGVDMKVRFQEILGDDYTTPYRDHESIMRDLNGYHRWIKQKATMIYGELPF